MNKSKQSRPQARVVVEFDGEVIYVARLKAIADDRAEVNSTMSVKTSLQDVANLFTTLGEAEQRNYWMGRVRALSKEQKESLDNLFDDEQDTEAPF